MKLEGFGVGFRPQHFDDLCDNSDEHLPEWLEVLSENFMATGGQAFRNLMSIREKFPVCLHGVSMSIAGTDPIDRQYLKDLKDLVKVVDPIHVSDHLCWTSLRGHNSHDLLPVPYTEQALSVVCSRIDQVQNELGRTVLFENPTAYIAFQNSDMSEGEFLAAMAKRTGCGILLDVNNLFVNCKNLGVDVLAWLAALDPKSIGYLHMAGHTVTKHIRVDTHDHQVSPEVWDLYSYIQNTFGSLPAMIEWDDKIPSWSDLRSEVSLLRDYAQRNVSPDTFSWNAKEERPASPAKSSDLRHMQESFFHLITSEMADLSLPLNAGLFVADAPASPSIGVEVYANAYLQRLIDVTRGAFPTLELVIGKKEFSQLLSSYLAEHHPAHYSVKYVGAHLANYKGLKEVAERIGIDALILVELVAFEWNLYDLTDIPGEEGLLERNDLSRIPPEHWAQVTFDFHPAVRLMKLHYRVDQTVELQRNGDAPPQPIKEPVNLLMYRSEGTVAWRELSDLEAFLFEGVRAKQPFELCCTSFQKRFAGDLEEVIFNAVEIVGDWIDNGLIESIN